MTPAAAGAIAVFCYQARKYIGAFAAVLDGLDTLVFTGGIGASVISAADSKVAVRVIKTNEELVIARHASSVAGVPASPAQPD